MKIFLFIISYVLLDVMASLSYFGLLLLFLITLQKIFKMNEDKWNILFTYGKGKGLYYIMVIPYLIMLFEVYSVSMRWFEWINFEFNVLASTIIVTLLTIRLIYKLPKLKKVVNKRYR